MLLPVFSSHKSWQLVSMSIDSSASMAAFAGIFRLAVALCTCQCCSSYRHIEADIKSFNYLHEKHLHFPVKMNASQEPTHVHTPTHMPAHTNSTSLAAIALCYGLFSLFFLHFFNCLSFLSSTLCSAANYQNNNTQGDNSEMCWYSIYLYSLVTWAPGFDEVLTVNFQRMAFMNHQGFILKQYKPVFNWKKKIPICNWKIY